MDGAQDGGSVKLSQSDQRSAERGLDWLNLFVANIQTGFGPFIAVYLTTQGWSQGGIGFALSLGTLAAMASQVPAGALVDAIPRKDLVAGASVLIFTLSALIFAVWPAPLFVYIAEILHGVSSCMLGPAIAAISLTIAGQATFGARVGRNARFSSIGNGLGAALMGACGYYISSASVFYLTAVLTMPALLTIIPLSRTRDSPNFGLSKPKRARDGTRKTPLVKILADRRLLIFAACAMLFTLANAAMLPFAATVLTKRAGGSANLLIAACIVLPQAIVAFLSPMVGRLAQLRGRHPLMLIGFLTLPLRGGLFALLQNPVLIVLVQALDGIAASCIGVLVPLVTSDIAGRSSHFNLSLGMIGLGIGIGATAGTALAGWIGDHFGDQATFSALALIGIGASLLVWLAMPETRPPLSLQTEQE